MAKILFAEARFLCYLKAARDGLQGNLAQMRKDFQCEEPVRDRRLYLHQILQTMKIFDPDSVTIVRKKGDEFIDETINTAPMLGANGKDAGKVRENVIRRLQKDPSVILVLADKDGVCNVQSAPYRGFTFRVCIRENANPYAEVTILYEGHVAHFEEYNAEEKGDLDEDLALSGVAHYIVHILDSIEMEDFSFVDADCPGFVPVEDEEEDFCIYDAAHLLQEEGYEMETVHTVGFCNTPVLFVHENEVLLLGTRHFDGESLFVEMKRIFFGVDDVEVKRALDSVKGDYPQVDVTQLKDHSWSFRTSMEADTVKKNFISNLQKDISVLREMIEKVEGCQSVGADPWPSMGSQRHLFIYEVIDASIAFDNLPM